MTKEYSMYIGGQWVAAGNQATFEDFNPYTGGYISTWQYGVNQSAGDWLIWLQVPLHFGTTWGPVVKIVWAAAGLSFPLLAVTGLLMYWNRYLRRKWKHLRKARPAAVAA